MGLTAKIMSLFSRAPAEPIFTAWPWERRLGRPRSKAYDELLGSYQSWVYACARVIANRVSAVPIRIKAKIARDGELVSEELFDHPLVELLKYPNPFMPRAYFWQLTQTHLDLCGNAYWLKIRDRLGVVRELWPLQPERMRVVPDAEKFVVGYLYRVRAQELAFEPDEIVHFKYPHPLNPWYGLSPVEALAYEVDADLYMRIYQKVTFENDATPSGVLTTTQFIDEDSANRLRARWYERYGGVVNRAKVAILHSGLDFKPIAIPPKDLEFLHQARINRDKLLAAFGVPASKLGLVEDVNRANAEANDATFNQEAIAPRLCLRDEFLTLSLARDFDARLYVESDDPVPRNREADRLDRQAYLAAGVLTINEVREQLGKKPVPWGAEAYLPLGAVPASLIGEGSGAAGSGESPPSAESYAAATSSRIVELRNLRDRRWQRFALSIAAQERRFVRALRGLFAQQQREVLARLKAALSERAAEDIAKIDAILFDRAKNVRLFRDVGEKFIRQAMAARGAAEIADLGLEISFDAERPALIEMGKQLSTKFATEVNATTRRLLRESLTEGIGAGETVEELSDRVAEIYGQATGYRSERIARTVVVGASNAGAEEAYQQSGVEKKEWLTARDESVRPSHQAAEGQRVGVRDSFTVGGEPLRYPGDPNGPAGEIINCRCTLLPVIEETE